MTDPLVRLHITPLTPDLLPAILGRQLIQVAQNVSFHSIQTAPESSYGYVELPKMEADKVKKKLNGAILKGKKVSIEEARPKKRRYTETEGDSTTEPAVQSQSSKKSKRDPLALVAHELSPDRKVKRGWTEPKTEKSKKSKKDKVTKPQAPSKFTEKSELLFRTNIPANRKSEDAKDKRQKKSGKADIVHEFEKTTVVPSFLRNSADGSVKPASEYKDGEGWVDSEGNVVEAETTAASRKRKSAKQRLNVDVTKAQSIGKNPQQKNTSSAADDSSTSASSSSTSLINSDSIESDAHDKVESRAEQSEPTDETSSSGSSSDPESSSSSSSSELESESNSELESEPESLPAVESKQLRSESPPSLNDSVIASKSETEPASDIHPLEALFKRPKQSIQTQGSSAVPSSLSTPKPPRLELHTSFSFFQNPDDIEPDEAADGEDENGDENGESRRTSHSIAKADRRRISLDKQTPSTDLPPMPLTPFSTQDFHRRRLRSAAPTPDTADIRKSHGYGSLILGEDDPDDVLSEYGDNDHDHDHDHEHNHDHDHDSNNNDDHDVSSSRHSSNDAHTRLSTDRSGGTSTPIEKPPVSEFEKKFWEKRGENNRAWKARRRAVLKEKRQRENRRSRPVGF